MKLNKKALLGILIAAATFSGSAVAALPGIYAGLQLGQSNSNISPNNTATTTVNSVNNKGFAGRIYGGYQFDQYWSAELGYTQFSTTKFNRVNNATGATTAVSNKIYAIDLVGKGTWTFDGGVGIFGKAGLAFVNQNISGNTVAANNNSGTSTRFTYGVGAQYEFTPNVVADIAWTRIQSGGKLNNNADFYGVGLAYHFG